MQANKQVMREIWFKKSKRPITSENIVQVSRILHEQRFHLIDKQNFQTCERVGSVAVAKASKNHSNAKGRPQLSPLAICLSEHKLQPERRCDNDVRCFKRCKKLNVLAIDADAHSETVVGITRHKLDEIIRTFAHTLRDGVGVILSHIVTVG